MIAAFHSFKNKGSRMTAPLTSLWKPCAATLLPLVTACATGPAPLTPEQQVQIATANAAQARAAYTAKSQEYSSIKLHGLYNILDKQGGTLSPQEIQILASEIFKTIQKANTQEKGTYAAFMQQRIAEVSKTDPAKAQQIALTQKIVAELETEAEKPARIAALTTQMNAALQAGNTDAARGAAIDLFIENHADKNGHVTFKYSEQTTLPMTFTSRAINPSEMVDFSKIDPKTIHYTGICNLLKPRLLAGLSPAATAGTIKPLSDWVCVPFSSPAP